MMEWLYLVIGIMTIIVFFSLLLGWGLAHQIPNSENQSIKGFLKLVVLLPPIRLLSVLLGRR